MPTACTRPRRYGLEGLLRWWQAAVIVPPTNALALFRGALTGLVRAVGSTWRAQDRPRWGDVIADELVVLLLRLLLHLLQRLLLRLLLRLLPQEETISTGIIRRVR